MRDVGKFYLEDGGRKNRMGKRWITDLALTMILLFLIGYSLIGEEIHEWLGLGMLLLMIFHHALNVSWYQNLKKGQYSPYRCVQTALTALLLFTVLDSMFSGLMLSQYVLDFLPFYGGNELARALHLPCAYWGFLFMGLHLGLHWGAVMGMARRIMNLHTASKYRSGILRLLAAVISCYGLYAFFHNGLPDYLLLRSSFVFFPPDQTAPQFLMDYAAIMGLYLTIVHYGGIFLRRLSARKTNQ